MPHRSPILALLLCCTPAAAGHDPGRGSAVAEPRFSVGRGFYSGPQVVTLTTATPGASIRYTTDGTTPGPTTGTLYTGPVRITRTTPLRAVAYAANQAPSSVVTHTYVFTGDVIAQTPAVTRSVYGFPASWGGTAPDYGMDPRVATAHQATIQRDLTTVPSLSVVMATDDLFGTRGIYSNSTLSGPLWERPTSLELIDPAHPDGSRDFQIDCGIRIQGGAFRNFNLTLKKSFRVLFKGIYGPTALHYPMFGPEGAQQFDTLVFRMESNDGYQWGNRTDVQYARDEFNRRSQADMGSPASRGRYLHLYLNGVYWGLYNVVERPDASFGESYFGADKAEWDAVNSGTPTNGGNIFSWLNLLGLAQQVVAASNESGRTAALMAAQGLRPDGTPDPQLADHIDIDNYIDYLLVNWYTGNGDWPRKNYYHGRERDRLDRQPYAGSRTSHGTFFFSWDAEWSLFLNSRNDSTGVNTGVAEPYGYLRRSAEFRVRFGDRAHRALTGDGALTPTRCLQRYADITRDHPSILVPELARWGDQHGVLRTVQQWTATRDNIRNSWLAVRTPAFLTILRNAGLYPSVVAPTLGLAAGPVLPGSTVQMTAPRGLIYYTLDGSDPRAIGGAVAAGAIAYRTPPRIDASTTVRARVLDGSAWSALAEARYRIDVVTISEVLASNTSGIRDNFGEREDWIELFNGGPFPVDAGGMFLTDHPTSRVRWPIPMGSRIPPGGTLLIWADDEAKQGPLHAPFKLAASGDQVLLYDADGATLLDRIEFRDQVADVSIGRLHDALPHVATFPDPTPGAPNDPPVCGVRRYSARAPANQALQLFLTGTPGLGKQVILQTHGGPQSGQRVLLGGVVPADLPLPDTAARLLVGPPLVLLGVAPTGNTGATYFTLPIPNFPPLSGRVIYLQALGLGSGPWTGSTGLAVRVCP